jgi:predicted HicB family RNase H-like nuclease
MSHLSYKGFVARIEFDPDDVIFVGRLAGINDVIGFHAENTEDLIAAFHEAVDGRACRQAKRAKPERLGRRRAERCSASDNGQGGCCLDLSV